MDLNYGDRDCLYFNQSNGNEVGIRKRFWLTKESLEDWEPEKSEAAKKLVTEDTVFSSRIEDSYKNAINLWEKLATKFSPLKKLKKIETAFQKVIDCIDTFWSQLSMKLVIGADDLVPVIVFIIRKAQVSKLYSQMQFIWHFSRDEYLNGKEGYAFTTFQIAVEYIFHPTNINRDGGEIRTLDRKSSVRRTISLHTSSKPGSFSPSKLHQKNLKKQFSFRLPKLSENISFKEAMADCRDIFQEFLEKENCADYLTLVEAITLFKMNPTLSFAEDIFNNYIGLSGAGLEIIIPGMREALLTKISTQQINDTLFDSIQQELLRLLETKLFPKFQKTLKELE